MMRPGTNVLMKYEMKSLSKRNQRKCLTSTIS